MVWNNSLVLSTCITFVATSFIDLGVLVYVVGFLDPWPKDPNSYIIQFISPNSNGYPCTNPNLLASTCIFGGLNTARGGFVFILSFCSSLACRPCCVYYCCCYYYCCKFYELPLLSI
jgi:hypothetical protein